MKAEDTVLGDKEAVEIIKQYRDVKPNQILPYHWHRETQAGVSFKAGVQVGIREEQKRMTRALRELHKQGWTLSDVIQAEDTMGED